MRASCVRPRVVLSLGAVALILLLARAAPNEPSKGEIVSETMVSLRQAESIASMGLHSVSPEDRQVSAHALVNLIEGVDGAHYDAAYDGSLDLPQGLLSHLAQLALVPTGNGESPVAEAEGAVAMLRTALTTMIALANGDLSERAQPAAFLDTLALVSGARDALQELLRAWGYEIWVRAGESVQQAVFRAWPGAVVAIEPGVYRETVEILDGITLRGIEAGVILEPPVGQDGVVVRATDELGITLENLAVRKAATGIRASSSADCLIAEVEISECETGVEVTGSAQLTFTECTLRGNAIGVRAVGEATVTISSCAVEASVGKLAAVVLQDAATAAIDGTEIVGGTGSGILVRDMSKLYVQSSLIGWNGGDGVVVAGGAGVYLYDVYLHGNGGFGLRAVSEACPHAAIPSMPPHTGEILPSSCSFGSSTSRTANTLGPSCPANLARSES